MRLGKVRLGAAALFVASVALTAAVAAPAAGARRAHSSVGRQTPSARAVRLARRGRQHDPRPHSHTLRRLLHANPTLQQRPLPVSDDRAHARHGHNLNGTRANPSCQPIYVTLH